jgi:hypothetical protein
MTSTGDSLQSTSNEVINMGHGMIYGEKTRVYEYEKDGPGILYQVIVNVNLCHLISILLVSVPASFSSSKPELRSILIPSTFVS